jgi:hypothetical protein
MPQTSHHNTAKALRSPMAPRLGLLFQLCKMATTRLSGQLDKGRGQRQAFIIIVSELLSIIVSIALAVYSKRALRRTDAIVRDGNFHPGVDPRVLLPWQFLQVAAATCILSFIVSIGACLYVAFTGPS